MVLCSAVIPTVGRSSLSRSVESVLQQVIPYDSFEVIVVNDSGLPLPQADWQKSDRVQVITTNHRERSVARNTGAAAAKGKYLHFLDDDDWLVPGSYQHLWELSQTTSAKWLYGWTQLVDRKTAPTIQLKHSLQGNCFLQAMAGEWIPLQSSWIDRAAFIRIGGFNPLLIGPEDIDLLRRVLIFEELDETPNIIACVIMGGEGSTTNYAHHPAASRAARDQVLKESGVFRRMQGSARSPFWTGQLVRIYMTSFISNIKSKCITSALSRFSFALAGMVLGKTSVFHKEFWQAVSHPYASVTFDKGIQEAWGSKKYV